MSVEAHKATDRRLVEEALNAGNLAIADALIAPDFIDHTAPPGMQHGPAGFKAAVAAFRTAFPDLQVTIEDHIGAGDRVARRMTMRGTHQGELFGVPPSGRGMGISGIHLVRFKDGKIAEHWGCNDDVGLLQQLAVMPVQQHAWPEGEAPRTTQPGRPRHSVAPEANRAVVERFIAEVINQGNLAACDELIASDYLYHGPGMEVRGRDGIRGVFTMLRTAFPDWREENEDLLAEGDRVAFRVTGHGTHQGEFFGIPPTGRVVNMMGIDIVRLDGRQLVEHWAVFDQLGLLRQLGAVPAPGR